MIETKKNDRETVLSKLYVYMVLQSVGMLNFICGYHTINFNNLFLSYS